MKNMLIILLVLNLISLGIIFVKWVLYFKNKKVGE